MKKGILIVLGVMMMVTVFPDKAMATVMIGTTARSGNVIVNYTFNHNYYPRDWDYRYQMLADGTEQMRGIIYEKLKMPTILVVMPDDVFGRRPLANTIEYKSKCMVLRGDTANGGATGEKDFECYEVNLNTNTPSWEGMIKVLMSLQNFDKTEKLSSVRLEDLAADKSEWYERLTKGFVGFKNYYNVEWSPDSDNISALYWQNGKSGVEILANERIVARTENEAYPARAPVWLENGKYMAYATLGEVVWWSRETNMFRSAKYDANNLEVLLKYDGKSNTLNIAVDTAVMAEYVLYKLNLESGELIKAPRIYDFLGWPEDRGIVTMNYPDQVVSHDGQRKLSYEVGFGIKDDVIKIENLEEGLVNVTPTSVPKVIEKVTQKNDYWLYGWVLGIFATGMVVGAKLLKVHIKTGTA